MPKILVLHDQSACHPTSHPTIRIFCDTTARGALLEAKTMGFQIRPYPNRNGARSSGCCRESRRDRQMIEAILFREFSGQSLTDVAELFGVTRVRCISGNMRSRLELPAIMAALKLEPAGTARQRCRSGSRHHHRDPAMIAAIAAIRMRGFKDALRGR